jgi:hypothetical protein
LRAAFQMKYVRMRKLEHNFAMREKQTDTD